MLAEETNVRDKSHDDPLISNPASNQSTIRGDEHDLDLEPNEKHISNGNATLSEAGVIISNLKAKWDESVPEYTLDDVNLRVQPGTLLAIIGPVGAGKSRYK